MKKAVVGMALAAACTCAAKDKPYFESAVEVCRALQKGETKRAFLFCGTGMGMSMIAKPLATFLVDARKKVEAIRD